MNDVSLPVYSVIVPLDGSIAKSLSSAMGISFCVQAIVNNVEKSAIKIMEFFIKIPSKFNLISQYILIFFCNQGDN